MSGHLVAVSNGANSIVISDKPALNRKLTGSVDAASAGNIPQTLPNFGAFARIPDSLSGTITAVSGSQVTLQQSTGTIVINDQPALNARSTGNVAVGRQVVAAGYWLHGAFYATSFEDATP